MVEKSISSEAWKAHTIRNILKYSTSVISNIGVISRQDTKIRTAKLWNDRIRKPVFSSKLKTKTYRYIFRFSELCRSEILLSEFSYVANIEEKCSDIDSDYFWWKEI